MNTKISTRILFVGLSILALLSAGCTGSMTGDGMHMKAEKSDTMMKDDKMMH